MTRNFQECSCQLEIQRPYRSVGGGDSQHAESPAAFLIFVVYVHGDTGRKLWRKYPMRTFNWTFWIFQRYRSPSFFGSIRIAPETNPSLSVHQYSRKVYLSTLIASIVSTYPLVLGSSMTETMDSSNVSLDLAIVRCCYYGDVGNVTPRKSFHVYTLSELSSIR